MQSNNLFILNEYNLFNSTPNNIIIIDVLLFLSIICGILTILSKNPIISVLYLIGLYINIASYVILIGSQFIGLSYILIYIGAISILFIFILMLINIRISELISNSRNSMPLVLFIAFILNSILLNNIITNNIIYSFFYSDYNFFIFELFSFSNISMFITNIKWDDTILTWDTINSLGNVIYGDFSILLIIMSVILLVAMIGAILITVKQMV